MYQLYRRAITKQKPSVSKQWNPCLRCVSILAGLGSTWTPGVLMRVKDKSISSGADAGVRQRPVLGAVRLYRLVFESEGLSVRCFCFIKLRICLERTVSRVKINYTAITIELNVSILYCYRSCWLTEFKIIYFSEIYYPVRSK